MAADIDKKILLTGATGFIGRHLVKSLVDRGFKDLRAIVRRTSDTRFLREYDVELIYCDIADGDRLRDIDCKVDILFHCAGYVDNDNLDLLQSINVRGTENICELASRLNVKRMIYTSSVAVVSGNPQIPLIEELPFCPTNKYGVSKVEAEKVVLRYRNQGLKVVIVRPPPVYGEDEPHLLKLMLKLIKKRMLPLIGAGDNRAHMACVKNVTEFMIYCMDDDRFLQGAFFIADKEILTMDEISSIFSKAIGAPLPRHIPNWAVKVLSVIGPIRRKINLLRKDRVYSIEKILSLGFTPPYEARSSLEQSARALYEEIR